MPFVIRFEGFVSLAQKVIRIAGQRVSPDFSSSSSKPAKLRTAFFLIPFGEHKQFNFKGFYILTHYLIQVSRDNFENTATVNIRAHRGGDTSGNMLSLSPDNVTEFPSKQAAYK